MLISVSGKIGSGKDTVGKIIAILLNNPHLNNDGILTFLKKEVGIEGNWQIKKWADKLKDIVCILLNIDRETLEDREFKEKELGEEWITWKLPVYHYNYNEKYDSYEPYESGIYNLFNSREEALSFINGEIKDNPDELDLSYFEKCLNNPISLTPRLMLQRIGTDLFRNQLHSQVWVNALMNEYTKDSKFIITDTRFPNEADAVKSKGGINIRIERPNLEESNHPSETDLNNYEFDYIIQNDSDIPSLIDKVREILTKEKLL